MRLTTENEDNATKGKGIDEKDLKLMRDTSKKVIELDRQFKLFSG